MKACALLLAMFASTWGQTAELTPAWNIRKALDELVAQSQKLTPMLSDVKPGDWVASGASATYVDQHKSLLAEIDYLKRTAEELARKPESLTTTLQLYLRLQSLESMLDSFSHGIRRYQNPALADLVQSMISENDTHRVRLREYLVELAETKEQEFRIVDDEAQKCRGTLIRQPRSPKKQ
jgi:hypothetical protein